MSENPLATMKSSPANVSPSSTVVRNALGSSSAEPVFVVRQSPPPNSSGGLAMTST